MGDYLKMMEDNIFNDVDFLEKMEKRAEEYARSMVFNPDLHKDAIMSIKNDYMQGVTDTYEMYMQTMI